MCNGNAGKVNLRCRKKGLSGKCTIVGDLSTFAESAQLTNQGISLLRSYYQTGAEKNKATQFLFFKDLEPSSSAYINKKKRVNSVYR